MRRQISVHSYLERNLVKLSVFVLLSFGHFHSMDLLLGKKLMNW